MAGTVLEAGMDGTGAEDEMEDDMADVVSGTAETVITHRISSHRHHIFHSTHIMGISSTSNDFRSHSNSRFHSRHSSITTPGGGGIRPEKGVDNPGTLRPGAPPRCQCSPMLPPGDLLLVRQDHQRSAADYHQHRLSERPPRPARTAWTI